LQHCKLDDKFDPPNGELRSSWLSLAEGCRGTSCSPAKPTGLNKLLDEEQAIRCPRSEKNKTVCDTKMECGQIVNQDTEQGGQRTQADSEANLPDGLERFSKSAVSYPTFVLLLKNQKNDEIACRKE